MSIMNYRKRKRTRKLRKNIIKCQCRLIRVSQIEELIEWSVRQTLLSLDKHLNVSKLD